MPIRLILAAILLVLQPAAAWSQVVPEAPIFTAEAVRAHVDFLADDLLEGRKAGTRGHEIAAHYVAARFTALGLRPAGTGGGWFQQVPLAEYALDPDKPASLTVGGARFGNGEHVLIAPTPRGGNATQSWTAGAVFVGYGLDAPDQHIDDYAGLDVRGKFVVALNSAPRGFSQAVGEKLVALDKTAIAAAHGALGILYLLTPEDLKRTSWAAAAGYILQSQTNWLSPEGTAGGTDPRIEVGAYIDAEAGKALFAGAPVTLDQLLAAPAESKTGPKGFALRPQVTLARTSKVTIVNSPNVLGILPGSDPALASEYVVLSAHLDHLGTDPKLPGPDHIYNGAMDNAVGVATMLEVARAFAEGGKRPKRSILFVAMTGEEEGLLGSQYLARYPVTGTGRLVADVNLDMPILLYDFKDVVAFGAEHSTMGPIVSRAAASMGVKLSPDPMPQEQFFVRSDHYSFVQAGVPSVFLMTGFANGGEKAYRDFLAHNYHQVSDQTNLPFNWEAGAKFARINYLIAREIADGAEAPRWYEGDWFGDRFAPGQPRAKRP